MRQHKRDKVAQGPHQRLEVDEHCEGLYQRELHQALARRQHPNPAPRPRVLCRHPARLILSRTTRRVRKGCPGTCPDSRLQLYLHWAASRVETRRTCILGRRASRRTLGWKHLHRRRHNPGDLDPCATMASTVYVRGACPRHLTDHSERRTLRRLNERHECEREDEEVRLDRHGHRREGGAAGR